MTRGRFAWLCATALCGVGCISVPSYPEPAEDATLQPGFDPTSHQRGRWLCDAFDFVRVAAAAGDVLAELNNDIVINGSKPMAGGTEFSFVSKNTMFLGGDGTKVSLRLLVPDDREQPLTMVTRNVSKSTTWTTATAGTITTTTQEKKEQCLPVPAAVVIR